MLWTFLVAFALVVLAGAALVNGAYVLRELVVVIPTLFLITAFTFYLQNGRGDKRDLAFNILGPGATESGWTPSSRSSTSTSRCYTRYMLWLSDALRGDLGRSAIQGQEVSTAIAKAIPVSLQLMLYAQILALLIAIPLGVYAAYRANRRGDRLASGVALTALSIPNFVLGILLILFLALGGIAIVGPTDQR